MTSLFVLLNHSCASFHPEPRKQITPVLSFVCFLPLPLSFPPVLLRPSSRPPARLVAYSSLSLAASITAPDAPHTSPT